MPTNKEKMAVVVGKMLSDPVFRDAYIADPAATLKHVGVKLDPKMRTKLGDLASKISSGKLGTKLIGPGKGGDVATHCEIASSVGYA